MPAIVLLRHGQASFGAADYDQLSDVGRVQAAVAGDALAARGLRDPVMCSGDLTRQVDTAAIAGERMGLTADPAVDPRFNEYDHIGLVLQDLPDDEAPALGDTVAFQAHLDVALTRWIDADAPDGWRAFAGGAIAAVTELATSLPAGRDAVVATSGGVIAAITAHLLGGGAPTVVALNRIAVNAGLTTLLAGRGGLTLLTFNEHSHLSGDQSHLRTYR